MVYAGALGALGGCQLLFGVSADDLPPETGAGAAGADDSAAGKHRVVPLVQSEPGAVHPLAA